MKSNKNIYQTIYIKEKDKKSIEKYNYKNLNKGKSLVISRKNNKYNNYEISSLSNIINKSFMNNKGSQCCLEKIPINLVKKINIPDWYNSSNNTISSTINKYSSKIFLSKLINNNEKQINSKKCKNNLKIISNKIFRKINFIAKTNRMGLNQSKNKLENLKIHYKCLSDDTFLPFNQRKLLINKDLKVKYNKINNFSCYINKYTSVKDLRKYFDNNLNTKENSLKLNESMLQKSKRKIKLKSIETKKKPIIDNKNDKYNLTKIFINSIYYRRNKYISPMTRLLYPISMKSLIKDNNLYLKNYTFKKRIILLRNKGILKSRTEEGL